MVEEEENDRGMRLFMDMEAAVPQNLLQLEKACSSGRRSEGLICAITVKHLTIHRTSRDFDMS